MILNRGVFIFSIVGMLISAYMWSMHSHPLDIPCGEHQGTVSDCGSVALSKYSRFPVGDGPPVAMWGVFGYLGLTVLSFLRTISDSRKILTAALLLATGALGFSLWLTYIELNVLHKICKYCMTSQGIIAGIFLLLLTDWLKPLITGASKKS